MNYVTDNYNLSRYNSFIYIQGPYEDNSLLTLRQYSTSGGILYIRNLGNTENVKIGGIHLNVDTTWTIENLYITGNYSPGIDSHNYRLRVSRGRINIFGCVVDVTQDYTHPDSTGTRNFSIESYDGGFITIPASSTPTAGCTIKVSQEVELSTIFNIRSSGNMNFAADIIIEGDTSVADATIAVTRASLAERLLSTLAYPGRLPVVTTTGTITGKRYSVASNGILSTNGGGPDFFPGTEAGTTSSGGQYT